jgi:nucleotide-binding universal stress UspA family protein
MFKKLLVPTDGSQPAVAAAGKAVALAHETGARIVGLSVKPRFHPFTLRPEQVEDTRGDSWDVDLHAKDHLAALERLATAAGVPFEPVVMTGDRPWEAIVETARTHGCDLVVMGSHGRSGLGSLLLGSQTQHVLAHGKVPVLVVPVGATG